MEIAWYTQSPSDIFTALSTDETGLSQQEAEKRLLENGKNALPEPPVPGLFSIFLSQFLSPLIYILAAAGIIMLFMGGISDALVITFVLFFNAVVGTIQEGRAQRTLVALRAFVETTASVSRQGKLIVLDDHEIVPGDIILLQEGDKVPADARLISTHLLEVDESTLTGESHSVIKTTDSIPGERIPLHDQKNMVFKGTTISTGNGTAVVVATGLSSEIGKISKAIATVDTEVPLKRNIRFLSYFIIALVGMIGATLMFFGIRAGEDPQKMFATVVALAVSVIPEGLPIVMTLVLAAGVWRMTKRNVLVKRLQAVEALGQADIIAVDKTGTLTKNEMVLVRVYIDGKFFEIQDQGYEPKGDVLLDEKVIDPLNHQDLMLAGRVAAFCSNAHAMYIEDTKSWKISGEPTEAALEVFAHKLGFKDAEQESPETFELPFNFQEKFHATTHTFEGKHFLSAVGAPERILDLSENVWRRGKTEKLSRAEKEVLESIFIDMSSRGLRVLSFAIYPDAPETIASDHMPPLTFCGFYAMKDPLRKEVVEAIQKAREAGIRVVMTTGDHKVTARAIAEEAGIMRKGDGVITGEQLDKFSDKELLELFATSSVFARVTPAHKLRIIELFKKHGNVVAMTGDGVNDAPSLAAADLGVAMGKIGTEVAKEAADLVLLDDNLGNIIYAVEEGRSIYKTIKKVILYLFSTSIGEVVTISGALLLGLPLPVLPIQIIWLNFVTDGFLDVALGMESKEQTLLTDTPSKPPKYILDPFTLKRMVFMGIVIAAGSLFIFTQYLSEDLPKALTMTLTTLAIFQWFNAWNCKSEDRSVFAINPFKNMYLVAATAIVVSLQIVAVNHPFMQEYLHTVPLTGLDWAEAVGIGSLVLVCEEVRKFISRTVFYHSA